MYRITIQISRFTKPKRPYKRLICIVDFVSKFPKFQKALNRRPVFLLFIAKSKSKSQQNSQNPKILEPKSYSDTELNLDPKIIAIRAQTYPKSKLRVH